MYDCKLMELGERSLRAGWAAGRSFFVVEGGGRMTDDGRRGDGREVVMGVWGDWRKWGLMRAGGLSGFPGVG